jgi:hypothetical protein
MGMAVRLHEVGQRELESCHWYLSLETIDQDKETVNRASWLHFASQLMLLDRYLLREYLMSVRVVAF